MSEENVKNAEFGEMSDVDTPKATPDQQQQNLEMIFNIPVGVSAELGQSTIKIKDLLGLSTGSVIELDRTAGESIDLVVNGVLIGKGEVVVVSDNFGLRITEIIGKEEILKKI